jgi:two-component system, OmpR family, sensor histidine kinase PhoQ
VINRGIGSGYRPPSLQTRQLLAGSLALVAFLGLTGYALDRAFSEAALSAVRDRLQTFLQSYLAGSDLSRANQLILPEIPPEPRFGQPGATGLYAAVRGEDFSWDSLSATERELPFDQPLDPGEVRFEGPIESSVGPLYRLGMGVAWEVSAEEEVQFTLYVAESTDTLQRQVQVFRRTLWVYLGGAGLLLLGVLALVLRWSLQPLRQVVRDLGEVERGAAERLDGPYPSELALLTDNLNAFVVSEREHLARYRNTLSDLAHSLKTPLAVIRSRLEAINDATMLRDDVREQVARMDEIVAYQLSRAATSGHQRFAAPIAIEPKAEEIVRSLEKLYASSGVYCEFELDPGARFHGELGDLMELLGNLLENAFKWARQRVLLTVRPLHEGEASFRAGLMVVVEDDGPGIPEDQVELLLQRGVRGDERVQGHGIGLSIVQNIVHAYRGEMRVTRSDELGGARFEVRIPPGR